LDATLYAFFSTIIAGIFFPEENPKLALLLTFAVFAISFIVLPVGALLFGFFGDRFGQRNNHYGLRSVLFSAALAMTLVALLPFYLVTTTHNTALILGSFGILAIIVAAFDGPLAAYLVSKFDVSVRHSGVSLSYNIGTAVFAGITPFILTYATDKTGITYFPSFFLISFALLACFILWKENYKIAFLHTKNQ
jgi:MHS family proline/betaine transporter-like MFS transporter